MNGWLVYGGALNAGRRLFPRGDNTQFSAWVANTNLVFEVHPMARAAAMWADANPIDLLSTRTMNPRVRTIRGLHAKWKEAQRPRPKAKLEEPTEDELRVVRKLQELVDHPSTQPEVRANAQRK